MRDNDECSGGCWAFLNRLHFGFDSEFFFHLTGSILVVQARLMLLQSVNETMGRLEQEEESSASQAIPDT